MQCNYKNTKLDYVYGCTYQDYEGSIIVFG